jgi:hypothetical protein
MESEKENINQRMNKDQIVEARDSGMSFRELVYLIKEYVKYFLRKSAYIILFGFLLSSVFVYLEWKEQMTYHAKLTFMVNEDDGGSIGGVGAILGQFGLGSTGGSEYNLDKIVQLGYSYKIIEEVLLDSILVGDAKDLVANHIIKIYDYHDKWKDSKRQELHGFYFKSNKKKGFEGTDFLALDMLYGRVVGDPEKGVTGLASIGYTESTGILKISTNALSEDLSLELTKIIYKYLSKFYIDKSTEKQRETLKQLEAISDSVSIELRSLEYKIALYQDQSAGVFRQSDRVKSSRMQRDIQVLSIMYGEAVKNKETARFVLANSTPFFQTIDLPHMPLALRSKSYFKQAVIGGIFGVFMGVVLFGFSKVYRDAMDDETVRP